MKPIFLRKLTARQDQYFDYIRILHRDSWWNAFSVIIPPKPLAQWEGIL